MKAISICGPWWWYILQGAKPVENRTWPSRLRGPLLIHAPQTLFEHDRIAAIEMAQRAGWKGGVPSPGELQSARGMIVGQVTMTDCVTSHASPFFGGPYGHVYADPVLFRSPVRFRGMQGIFEVPDDMVREARLGGGPKAGMVGGLFDEVTL